MRLKPGVYCSPTKTSVALRPSNPSDPTNENTNSFSHLLVSIYPNPTNGKFTIQSNQDVSSVKVINMYGKEVLKTSNQQPQTVNLSNQPRGIYFIHVSSGENRIIKKIIKQ